MMKKCVALLGAVVITDSGDAFEVVVEVALK